MAVIKARENSSSPRIPVATMGVGNASQSQRGLMTAQDKVMLDTLVNLLVPVGVILTFASDIDPNNIYVGTTWQKIEGKFLLGSSNDYALGDTGGEATHTLTVDEMPSHRHKMLGSDLLVNTGSGNYSMKQNPTGGLATDFAGGGQSHNNMPPYEVVNYWKRTA